MCNFCSYFIIKYVIKGMFVLNYYEFLLRIFVFLLGIFGICDFYLKYFVYDGVLINKCV